jgi:hypothetical protein
MDFWRDVLIPVVAAAVGTAAGATVAFVFERKKRQREMEDAHVTATNTALFSLFRIVNDLVVYRREHIEPRRSDPERWYTLPPTRLSAPVATSLGSRFGTGERPRCAKNAPAATSDKEVPIASFSRAEGRAAIPMPR